MAKEIHKLLCVNCSYSALPMYVPRSPAKLREAGHLKKCYCPACGKDINHAEIIEGSSYTVTEFHLEWAEGNFNEDGSRKKPWKQFINELKQQGKYKPLRKEKEGDYFG